MPWKARSITDEHLRLVARLPDGWSMSEARREFRVPRKTGDEIFDRRQERVRRQSSQQGTSPSFTAKLSMNTKDSFGVFPRSAAGVTCTHALILTSIGFLPSAQSPKL